MLFEASNPFQSTFRVSYNIPQMTPSFVVQCLAATQRRFTADTDQQTSKHARSAAAIQSWSTLFHGPGRLMLRRMRPSRLRLYTMMRSSRFELTGRCWPPSAHVRLGPLALSLLFTMCWQTEKKAYKHVPKLTPQRHCLTAWCLTILEGLS